MQKVSVVFSHFAQLLLPFHLIQSHALVNYTSAGRVVNGACCWHLCKWQLDICRQAVVRKTMALLIALNEALLSADLLCEDLIFSYCFFRQASMLIKLCSVT